MHPEKIGPYVIDRKIGSGGMGNVYLGIHEDSGQEVAVKVLPASLAREPGFVQRFSREVQALKKLSSAYIVRLYDDGETQDGGYYYSMEYVDGETLTALVSREKRIPWRETVEIASQIAAALKAAHDAGIVHRDLKPSNLIISLDGHVKLADFGVAHVFATTRLTRTGGVVGTAEYMSPEQARGIRATKHSDLYSLGAVMYVMLTGRPPFTGKMASDILHQHQFSQFDKPSHYVPDLPRLVEEFVCTLLEKKPEKRFPDALVVMRKLDTIVSRIEFADQASAETRVGEVEKQAAGQTDVAASGNSVSSSEVENRPGPATMVRNVVRQNIEQQQEKSAVAKFFDHTFVLITMFALVIAAGFYLSRTTAPDPAREIAEAKELFNTKAGVSWLNARDDVLIPILREDVFPEQQAELERMIGLADQYEFCRRLKMTTPTDGSLVSEVQRLIRDGFGLYANGDVAEARLQLEAVQTLINNQNQYVYLSQFLDATLTEWDTARDVVGRVRFIESNIETAKAAIDADNKTPFATQLLQSTIRLYEKDLAVKEQIAEAKELLNEISSN